MGILLCEQNFRDVWIRNKSVRAEIGQLLRTHTHTHAAKLVVEMGYRVCREYSTAVDLSLLVVECAMELALDIIGERFTTLYQMSKPTYLSFVA